jgi:hypothetical protein
MDLVDAGGAGAVGAPFFEEGEVSFITFCFDVYASVWFVAYKAFQGKFEGFLVGGGAEEDPLYFSGDAEGNVFGHAFKVKKSGTQRTQSDAHKDSQRKSRQTKLIL